MGVPLMPAVHAAKSPASGLDELGISVEEARPNFRHHVAAFLIVLNNELLATAPWTLLREQV
jgi:hypothetical protein